MRLKECIKSEQSLYQKDVENLVLEKPRLLDMEKSVDTLMVKKTNFDIGSEVLPHYFSFALVLRPRSIGKLASGPNLASSSQGI